MKGKSTDGFFEHALTSTLGFEEARSLFTAMILKDPRNVDFLCHHSNLLHTLELYDQMSFLASITSSIERNRPETFYVIGNYYSLISRHVEAVSCFQQALLLDRGFSAAWTLLGYEYFRLQKPEVAVDCYLRAAKLNQKDFRAFIGLGKVHESLNHNLFALFEYVRALKLRPRDPYIWKLVHDMLALQPVLPTNMIFPPSSITEIQPLTCALETATADPMYSSFKTVELLFGLGKIHLERGDHQGGISLLELCLAEYLAMQRPNDAEADAFKHIKQSIVAQVRQVLAEWTLERREMAITRRAFSQQMRPDKPAGPRLLYSSERRRF
jgi:anaphase-promoting complex subunit 8